MSKSLACLIAMLSLMPASAEDRGGSPVAHARIGAVAEAADQACRDAVKQVGRIYDDQTGKPLSSLAVALVRRCNGHPSEMMCQAMSRVMLEMYGKTPFTCGTNAADSIPLILP